MKPSELLEFNNTHRSRSPAAASLVLLVDLQERLLPAVQDAEAVLSAADRLLRGADRLGIPVRATEHCADAIGPTVEPLRRRLGSERLLTKRSFDAFAEPGMPAALRALGRPAIVVAGVEAHVCVAQTALGLLDAGWRVLVAEDACGSRRTVDRDGGLARLRAAGCIPVTVEALLFEWLGSADHPAFRDVLAIIKEAR